MAETTVENQLGSLRDEDAEGRDWSRVRPREISDQQWRAGKLVSVIVYLGPGSSLIC